MWLAGNLIWAAKSFLKGCQGLKITFSVVNYFWGQCYTLSFGDFRNKQKLCVWTFVREWCILLIFSSSSPIILFIIIPLPSLLTSLSPSPPYLLLDIIQQHTVLRVNLHFWNIFIRLKEMGLDKSSVDILCDLLTVFMSFKWMVLNIKQQK